MEHTNPSSMGHADSFSLELTGTITRGEGTGGYYVQLPGFESQFETILGKKPFPGTLNLRIHDFTESIGEQVEHIKSKQGITIHGFSDGENTYFSAIAVHCQLQSKDQLFPCLVVFPKKTIHKKDLFELISTERLLDHSEIGDVVKLRM
jgi:riboflavin kinase, archaea type